MDQAMIYVLTVVAAGLPPAGEANIDQAQRQAKARANVERREGSELFRQNLNTQMTNAGELRPAVFTGHVLSAEADGGVLYAPARPDNPTFRAEVSAIIGMPCDYFDARADTPSVDLMDDYDAVFTWVNNACADQEMFSDRLADYVDGGGKVILGQRTLPTQGDSLSGEIMTEASHPATASSYTYSGTYHGDGIQCEQVLGPVSAYDTQDRDLASAISGAATEGTFGDALPVVIWWSDGGVHYSAGNTGLDYCSGDWAQLTANMVICTEARSIGACCDPYTGDCTDGVAPVDCLPPLQWSYETSCEGTFPPGDPWPALYPPCGNPGACCDDFGDLCEEDVLEVLCESTRFAGRALCDDFEPPCGQLAFILMFDPGTDPPPDWQCGCPMTPLPPDPSPLYSDVTSVASPCSTGGDIEFSIPLSHLMVGDGWAAWSHGYTGDVYYTNGATEVTLTMPPISCGFHFYVEPNPFEEHTFKLTINGTIESEEFTAYGPAGAAYAGVCGTGLETITIECTSSPPVDFAIGEFGLCCSCMFDPYGACCDPYTGDCTDDAVSIDCLPPLEFTYETSCADLVPPCGNPGACCDIYTGECEDPVLELLCDQARFESGEQCAELEPLCGNPGCCCYPEDGETVTDPYEEFEASCQGRFLPGVLGADCTSDAFVPECGLWICDGVLYAPSQPDNPDFRDAMSEILGMPVDYFDARYDTPTVEMMADYCAVMTWVNYSYADNDLFGDRLAEYVDGNGRVILGQWTLHTTQNNWLAGEIMTEAYCPATASSYTYGGTYQGDGNQCEHVFGPVMEYDTQYRDLASAISGAVTDGTFEDGLPAVIWRSDRGVHYSAGNTGLDYCSGDWAQLTANMVICTDDPLVGACCDPYTTVCDDDVASVNCPPPDQFFYQEACADLDPPCGNPGACCDDFAFCVDACEDGILELNCEGTRFAPLPATCADFSPPCGSPCFSFVFGPGTDPPPETLCGYPMTGFPLDPRPIYEDVVDIPSPCPTGGEIELSIPLSHRRIGDGWASWSHGYTGDVYYTNGASEVTLTLPPGLCGLYFYVQPNSPSVHTFKLIAYGVIESEEFSADGSGGAAYAGLCYEYLETVTVMCTDGTDFAIGELGVGCFCCDYGACCDPYTGDCSDDVMGAHCLPPLEYHFEEACADLVPPCGNPGACCDIYTGECDDPVLELLCDEARFESGEECAELEPECGTPGCCCEDDVSSTPFEEFEANCEGRFLPGVVGDDCVTEAFDPPCGEWQCSGILYVPAQPDDPSFRDEVSDITGQPCDYWDARVSTPTLEDLEDYCCVFTWVNYAYADKVAMGDVLADYVDDGGKVILGQWTYHSDQTNWLEGRIMDVEYCPVTVSTSFGSGCYAGDGIDCVHVLGPVLYYCSDYLDIATLAEGPFLSDGTFTTGSLAVAWRWWACRRDVYYSPGNTGGTYGAGDWAQLVANMCSCTIPVMCGACCDPYTGICTDHVQSTDCPPPLQWTYATLCADLYPPCGNPGACCDIYTGECEDPVLELLCDEARFESGEQCAELEPLCGNPGCCCVDDLYSTPFEEFQANCGGRFLPGVVGDDCVTEAFDPPCGEWECVGMLYAPSQPDNPAFRDAVSEILGMPVDYFDARYDTPTVEMMADYCAVMTWADYAYADNDLFGDRLAEYVDGNGRVILGQWTLPTAGNYLAGEIMTEAYCPATASSYTYSGTYQGDGNLCEHVLGPVSYYGTNYRDLASAISGAVTDGTFEDGLPAVIWRSDRLVHYSAGNTGLDYCSGDWAQLTANMVICTIPPYPGACCDPYTGICTNHVESIECPPPLQWTYATLCTDLDPPCGNPGACCEDSSGDCEDDVFEINCAGTRFAPLPATCVDFDPPCGYLVFTFVFDPGTDPPPDTLCGCPMNDFPLDDSSAVYDDVTSVPSPCPVGGEIEFSIPMSHRRIGQGWSTWSHGYTEDVYYTNGATEVTITLPPATYDFYFYVEPSGSSVRTFKLIANGAIESEEFTAHGSAGAAYAGVCIHTTQLETITIECTSGVDFAIGEFGICCYGPGLLGACCHPEEDVGGVGYCEDYVEVMDCPPPLQWTYETSCEGTFPPYDPWPALDPPCGNPGACCDIFTGECADPVLELLCEYDRFEAGEQCDELEPPCGTPGCCCYPEDGETVTDPYEEFEANCEGRFLPGVLGGDCVAEAFDPTCGLWTCSGVMYAPANPDNASFRMDLAAMLGQPVDYFDARTDTPTVEEMRNYCAVLTWANYAYADKVLMGDRLAEYVDGGGKALLGQWCLPTADNYLAGEIITDAYCPATASSYTYGGTYQGDGTDCVHCMVDTYEPTYRDRATAEEGAETDGTFDDGYPAVIWRPDRRVYYNAGHTGESFSTGDYERLTANMVQCTGPSAYGACCDPTQWDPDDPWGLCNDEVECNDCPPPLGFYLNESCAGLDPLCGIPGACCIDNPPPEEPPPGECTVELKVDCEGRHLSGEECDPDPFVPACGWYTACTHSITMWDDWGDGWNGGYIDVYINGQLVLGGVTLASGSGPQTVYCEAGTNSEITTVWTPGGWPYECSYCIYDGYDKEICCDGLGGVQPAGVTCLGNCEPPTGRCCLEYEGCQVIPEADCEDAGGIYGGDDTDCGDLADCDDDGMTDLCAILEYGAKDCNDNLIPDSCDVADCGECLAPCDENAWCQDCQGDGIPDGCQLGPWCGDGTCSGGETCVTCPEDCGECPPWCEHSITMWDSYGNGWNGCTIDVYVNDELVLGDITLASGSGPETVVFNAETGDTIFVDFTCVSWCSEPSYCVYDGWGMQLGCATGGDSEGDGDLTVTGNCEEPSGSGDCCWDHCDEGPGCDDPVCEASVCAYDSYCCIYCWDSQCADEAQSDPSCVCDEARDGELLISQPPNQSNGMFADCDCDFCGQPQVLVENFVLAEDIGIETVRFWGGFYPSDHEPANDWYIAFYEDAGGVAGAEIASYSGAAAQEQTGITLFGVHEWVIDFTIDPPLDLTAGTYHVACYLDSVGDTDSWFWEIGNYDSEHGVPGQGYGFVCPPEFPYYDSGTDMAFELYGKSGPLINDCNTNCVPDSCDLDCNGNGIPDDCEEEPVVCGDLDLKPGSCPNSFNRGSHGVLPVALMGSEFFDLSEVDIPSIRLSRADGVGGEAAPLEGPPGPKTQIDDVATPFAESMECECAELTGDGIDDISMKFSTDEVVEALELDDLPAGALVPLVITGGALGPCGGQTFMTATDCLRLVPPGTGGGVLTVESNVAGAWIDVSPPDETLEGGGVADFERFFPLTTVVTLTAQPEAQGRPFVGWLVNGVMQSGSSSSSPSATSYQRPVGNVIEVTILENEVVKAVYADSSSPTVETGTQQPGPGIFSESEPGIGSGGN